MRMVVVLPEPFGPRKPTISPGATFSEMWSTTVASPKRLVRLATSMTFATSAMRDLGPGRSTSTIWPGCRRRGLSCAARASIR